MGIMNQCHIFVTGNETEGYSVTFSDYALFDTSDKATKAI